MRVTEIDWQPREDRQVRMPRHLHTLIPSERPAKWRRKGDWKCESLWSLLSSNFNALYTEHPRQEDATRALGRMTLGCGAEDIADWTSLSADTRVGGAEDFWPIFTLLGVKMSQTVPLR
jgi:hypothetical protein